MVIDFIIDVLLEFANLSNIPVRQRFIMTKEINFQCSDCGLCFQDSEEDARFAEEHVRLTGHNEDLMSFDVDQLLEKAKSMIDQIAPIKPKKTLIQLLNDVCETKEAKST